MLNPEMIIVKVIKEQVESNTEKTFSSKTMMPIIILLRKDNTRVLSLMMYHENRKKMIFKLLRSVVYCIIDNYVYVYYLSCMQNKLHVNFSNKGYEKTT